MEILEDLAAGNTDGTLHIETQMYVDMATAKGLDANRIYTDNGIIPIVTAGQVGTMTGKYAIGYGEIKNSDLGKMLSSGKVVNILCSEKEGEQCWICLEASSTSIDNPLINICKCKNKFVHYLCLKQYLQTKIKIRENFKHTVYTYCCNKFNCDMCLTPYPTRFKISEFNKEYELIDLNLPEEYDYMILESLDFIKEKDDKKGNIKRIHVIQLTEDEIYIGRN